MPTPISSAQPKGAFRPLRTYLFHPIRDIGRRIADDDQLPDISGSPCIWQISAAIAELNNRGHNRPCGDRNLQ